MHTYNVSNSSFLQFVPFRFIKNASMHNILIVHRKNWLVQELHKCLLKQSLKNKINLDNVTITKTAKGRRHLSY
jgi:hypothetical protein